MERRVLVQGTMRPRLIIIGGICTKDSAQVPFTKHNHVVQALPADRANEPLDICSSVPVGSRNSSPSYWNFRGAGLEGEGLKQIAEDARIEDRNHFEALVPRIYELGGHLPADMVEFHNISACPPAKLPANRETSTPYWKCYWGPSNAPSKAIPTLRHDLRQGPSNLRSFAHNPARSDRA